MLPAQSSLGVASTTATRVSPIPRYLVSQAPGIGLFQGPGLVNIMPGTSGLAAAGSLEALAQLQAGAQTVTYCYNRCKQLLRRLHILATMTLLPLHLRLLLPAASVHRIVWPQKLSHSYSNPRKAASTNPKDIRTEVRIVKESNNVNPAKRNPSPHRFTHSPRSGAVAESGQRLTCPQQQAVPPHGDTVAAATCIHTDSFTGDTHTVSCC